MAEKTQKINEWSGGSGFSINPYRGGRTNRGGFSGGSGGSLQTMYVYEIKPLNHTLEQKPNDAETIETICPGKLVRGIELNKRDGKYHEGVLLKTEKTSNGTIKFYVISDPKTSLKMKLDPSTVTLVDKTKAVDPLDLSIKRDLQQRLKDQQKMDIMRENKIVSENLENYLKENLNESLAYYCATCGERAEHEEIEENPRMRCSNCGDSNCEQEH